MRYYLSQYVGTGAPGDEYRPTGADEAGAWSSIDLRRPGVTSGWCLFATDALLSLQGLVDLGADLDGPVPPAVRRRLSDRLGVELAETTVRRLFRELLLDQAATDGTRWRPIGVRRRLIDGAVRRVREIHLGGEPVWEQVLPLDTPGAAYTESFVQADSTTLGPNLTWSEVQGDPQTIADTARAGSLGAQTHARAQHDLDTDDHYCSARIGNPTTSGSGVRFGGPMVRFSPSANTSYFFRWQWSNAGGHQLAILRNNAGSYTNLTSVASNPGNPSTLRLEVNGSSLRALDDGVEVLTTTDTNITGNLRCGFGLQAQSNLNQILVDVWSAGDLVVGATGGSVSTVTVTASGDGTAARSGSATAVVSASVSGAGSKHASGGSVASCAASTTGTGEKGAQSGTAVQATVTTTGDGTKQATSGSTAVVTVTATGDGVAATSGGGGSRSIVNIAATGQGTKHVSGGATSACSVSTSGAGAKDVSGGSLVPLVVTTQGAGEAARAGGSSAPVVVTTTGDGVAAEEGEPIPDDYPVHITGRENSRLSYREQSSSTFREHSRL